MELREIESEAWEQQEKGEEIEQEVKLYKERTEKLEQAVKELSASVKEVQSDHLTKSLEAAEEAKQATEKRLEVLRTERDTMLAENQLMSEKVNTALDKRKHAMETVSLIEGLSTGAQGDILTPVHSMRDALRDDLGRLGSANKYLDTARQQLEALAI